MKIPFDIKYRPQIESGKYKVETRNGLPVRIICWDKKSEKKYGYHIVGLIEFGPQHEESTYYTIDGKGRLKDKEPDLFIVTPEKEKLTPFEVAVKSWMGVAEDIVIDDSWVKNCAKELLSLARKELQPEIDAEIEKAYRTQDDVVFRKGWEQGRADALKDSPRWRRDDSMEAEQYITVYKNGSRFHYKGHSLLISDLTKLPGFNEDEK